MMASVLSFFISSQFAVRSMQESPAPPTDGWAEVSCVLHTAICDRKMLIHPAEARRQFREFAAGEITNENLAYGALLVALEDSPRLDVQGYLDELDALAARVER